MGKRILLNGTNKALLSSTEFATGKRKVLLGSLKEGLKSVWEFDETSGSTLYDERAVQNLTKQSNVTVNNTGKLDKCIYFPGASNSATNAISNTAYSNLGEYTVNVWIKDARIGSGTGAAYYMAAGQVAFGIFADYGTGSPFIRAVGKNYLNQVWDVDILSMPAVNTWFMVTVTLNIVSKTAMIYKNGVLSQSSTINDLGLGSVANFALNGLALGTYYDGITYDTCVPDSDPCATLHMQGYMDQLAIWTRELDQTEITDLYNSGNGLAYASWT